MPTRDDIPDAESVQDEESIDFEHLVVGPPFAIAHDCGLVENLCHATIECECGQALRLNLMVPGAKGCPKCKTHYTHVLLVCQADNDEIVGEALELVFEANGVEFPDHNPDDGDDAPAEVVEDGEPE